MPFRPGHTAARDPLPYVAGRILSWRVVLAWVAAFIMGVIAIAG